MSGPELITLGCRLNLAESETMRALAAGQDDLVIVNSCAVTAEAVRQTRKAIRQARRARPEARILVTGCAAEIDRAMFEAMAEVERVVPNGTKLEPSSFLSLLPTAGEGLDEGLLPSAFFSDGEEKKKKKKTLSQPSPAGGRGLSGHARAFVPVQNGCDHSCTFCIIPQGRGPSRSVPAGVVIEQIRALVDAGTQEVVLTGVDLTSYGPDLPGQPTLGQLVERILRLVPALPRLRLSSLDSVEIDDRLFQLVTAEPRIMPHLHLSLQAGDDMVLKRMKRRHTRAQSIAIVERLKAARPEIAIGADLIAGFPTETEAMADNSLRLIDECDIVFGHIFPYSPRAGTPAARMPQVAPEVARARAKRLREAAGRRQRAWLEGMVDSVQQVLVELDGESGHAENFAKVQLQRHPGLDPGSSSSGGKDSGPPAQGRGDDSLANRIVPVRITGVTHSTLIGEPA